MKRRQSQDGGRETRKRSLLKTSTYRFGLVLMYFSIFYAFTGNVGTALTASIMSGVIATIWYYFHERWWNRVQWGREKTRRT